MSIEWTHYALIGVRFSLNSFTKETQRDSCSHSERLGNTFCPVCGVRVETFTDSDFQDWHEMCENLRDAAEDRDPQLIFPETDSNEFQYLGYGLSIGLGQESKPMPIPDLTALQERLRAILEPYDLWKQAEPTFGLYALSVAY